MSISAFTSTSTRQKEVAGKRTNSLGWAKSDCHTCAAVGRSCDRRRPRCSACLSDGVICSGYVQQLNWERGALRLGKSRPKATPKDAAKSKTDRAGSGTTLPTPSTYVFVDEAEGTERVRRKSRTNSKSSEVSLLNNSLGDLMAGGPGIIQADSICPISPVSTFSFTSTDSSLSTMAQQSLVLPFYPQVTRNPGDIEDALAFYHSAFSYTTLTYATKVNPWQSCLSQINDDLPCVRYAAVAIAQRQRAHMSNKPEGLTVLRLKSRALSIFASRLNELSFESGISTCLLLIALEYAETGYAAWTIHVRGAFRILETHGGIVLAESRPNLRSQIAMLIWYDIHAALISRHGPVFPRYYLETLMMWQADSEWTMLALNGMPDEMFLFMYDLTAAAALPEDVRQEAVFELEKKITEAQINIQGNRHLASMSQAWKLCLLLYCSRVFPELNRRFATSMIDSTTDADIDRVTDSLMDPNQPPQARPTQLDAHSLAMQILDIADAIPSHSNFQKQCLFPIVLAATEMTSADMSHRAIAVDYSERWKQRTGMWIFNSGLEFMRGVWARNDTSQHDTGDGDGSRSGSDAEADPDGGGDGMRDQWGWEGDGGRGGNAREEENDDDNDHNHDHDQHHDHKTRPPWVPWTEIYPAGVDYGFLFG